MATTTTGNNKTNTTEKATGFNTIQSGIKNNDIDAKDMMKYALFMGGLNATKDALVQYDPLKTGYGRLFCVSAPDFVEQGIPNEWLKFKHILEYANTSIQGINDITMNTQQLTGGYAGRSMEVPTHMTDDTNSFTVQVYELAGSPIRTVIQWWLNGISDLNTGLTHYNGVSGVTYSQRHQTAEFIYIATDNSGEKIEYACLLCNCFPKNLKNDHWNYTAGTHDLVEYQIDFSCVKYESIQINGVAQSLLDRYRIITNSMNMFSGYYANDEKVGAGTDTNTKLGYNPNTGELSVNAADYDSVKPRTTVARTFGKGDREAGSSTRPDFTYVDTADGEKDPKAESEA